MFSTGIELVVAGIEQPNAIMRRAGDVDRLQGLVAADAVIGMHDEIPWCQRRRLGDELVEIAPAPRRAGEPVAEDILLAEQDDAVRDEALLDRQDREADRRARQSAELAAVRDATQIGQAALVQYGQEPLGRSRTECGDRSLAAGFAFDFEIVPHRLEQHRVRIGALGSEIPRRPGAGIERVAVTLIRRKGRELHDRPAAQRGLPIPAVEKELVRADRPVNRRTGARCRGHIVARGVEIGDGLEAVPTHLFGLVVE
jgi:hypothetical protein